MSYKIGEEISKAKDKPKKMWWDKVLLAITIISIGFLVYIVVSPYFRTPDTLTKTQAICIGDKTGLYIINPKSCESCTKQLDVFGDNYVELKITNCGADKRILDYCISQNITKFPVWVYNGTRYPIVMTKQEILNLTGC